MKKNTVSVVTPLQLGKYLKDVENQKTLSNKGWVLLEDIPPSQQLIEEVLSPLGGLMPQYGQKKMWPVVPQCKGEGTSLGDQALRLHTELAEFQIPPEYVALYAEEISASGGALQLCDSRPFLATLTSEELDALMCEPMVVRAEKVIADQYGEYAYTSPILSATEDGLVLRLDQHFIDQCNSDLILSFRERLMAFAKPNTVEVLQPKGSLIVWDNRFILHGRTAFKGPQRRLLRCCIKV